MRIDRMGIQRPDTDTRTDAELYGSLYLVCQRHNGVNDYGGSNTDDVSKLDLITNASPGSTCLFANGDIYRRELDGWAKFGEEHEETMAASSSANPANLNLTPLDFNRNDLMGETGLNNIEEAPNELTIEPTTVDEDMR